MKEFWNKRFNEHNTFYGEEPNSFFKEFIGRIPAGRILLPGEGEGRNAIYAAKCGWVVDAFDFSNEARENASEKAENAGLMIHYELKDIKDYKVAKMYDVIALVYLHLPPGLRMHFHRQLIDSLEPGGYLIMEAFAKRQSKNIEGGPESADMLYSATELENDFSLLDISLCDEEEIPLYEGELKATGAHVIHFIGRKPY